MLSLLQKVLSRSARRSAGHAGVVLGEDSFALVLIRREGDGKPSIDHCRVHPAHGADGCQAACSPRKARREARRDLRSRRRGRLSSSAGRGARRAAFGNARRGPLAPARCHQFQSRRRRRGRLRDSGIGASHADPHALRRSGAFGRRRAVDQHAATRRERLLRDRHSRAVPAQRQCAAAAGRQGRRDARAQRELRAARHDAPGSDVPHAPHRHWASLRAARRAAR